MNRIVHLSPVLERMGGHLESPVVSGRDLEHRERALHKIRASGDTVADVPLGEEGHRFWPRQCTRCNPRE